MDWHARWAENNTPWDLMTPTRPLELLLESGRLPGFGLAPGSTVAVPGCGRGHDVRLWARHGHPTVGFDIVPEAVQQANALLRLNQVEGAEVLLRDLFGIGQEFDEQFDAVYDYTCFCAIPTHLRAAYGSEMAAILRPGGLWIGLAFPMSGPFILKEGPPHRVTPEDLDAALALHFERVADFPAEESALERRGHERWFVWRRR